MNGFSTVDLLGLALGITGAAIAVLITGGLLAIRDRRDRAPHVCWQDETRCAQCAPYATFSDASERAPHRCADCALPIHDPALAGGAFACPRCSGNWIEDAESEVTYLSAGESSFSLESLSAGIDVLHAHAPEMAPRVDIDAIPYREMVRLLDRAQAIAWDCMCPLCDALANARYLDETGN